MAGRGVAAAAAAAEDYFCEGEEQCRTCGKGHRSSLVLEAPEGGSICLVCFSNLVSDPASPSHHVSYALSQLSRAIRGGGGGGRGVSSTAAAALFLREIRACHAHLLVSPLVQALSSFDDEPLARQAIDLVSDLCFLGTDGSDPASASCNSLSRDFIARIADRLASGALAWSRRQVYTLHCLGVLLNCHQAGDPSTYIKHRAALVSNLVTGLQLPSEEIRGEILFVLYKLSLLQDPPWDGDDGEEEDEFSSTGVRLLRLTLEALLKTQNDDVRTNCVALLTVLARRGYFQKTCANDQDGNKSREAGKFMQTEPVPDTPLVTLFADAIKGPLLSSDTQVQIGTLDLILHSVTLEMSGVIQVEDLIEESITDYVFEILRLSGNKDPLIVSCLRVLGLLATAEEAFRQRLAIGFPTLLSALHYVAEIPLHPVQSHALKLVWNCVSNCPGMISISQVEELALILTGMFRRYTSGELGMLSETFVLACSTFVEVLKSPSSFQITKLDTLTQEASRNAILSSLSAYRNTNPLLLYSLYLLKEAFTYGHQESTRTNCGKELVNCIIEICEIHLLPWLGVVIEEGVEEDIVMGVLETFHLILLREPEVRTKKFAEVLASSSWFSWSFGCLGLFPSDRMKWRVYLMLSSVIDCVLGQDFGQPIRDAYLYLPSDPLELMFLLGEKSTHEGNLMSTQYAVLLILYVSSLFDERIADENQMLASLEQYILVNSNNFSCGNADPTMLTQLVHLYAFTRGTQTVYGTPYSPEAEKLLFRLIAENDWDLFSMGIHPIALKWLFQQDMIRTPLSNQILNFCRSYSTNGSLVDVHTNNIQIIDIRIIADLVDSGDNCLASLLVSLLKHLQDEGQEEDAIFVMNVIEAILNIFPNASNQFCLHGISDAVHTLYYSYPSLQIFTSCSLLVFNVLRSAPPKALSNNGPWLPITVKLFEWLIPKLADDTRSSEVHLIIGILCLILHHSTNQALIEASKAILLNSSLVSAVDHIIQAACAKGPALIDHNEETTMGESLIFVLLLYFFSLRSLHALLQESLDWQDFLMQPSDGTQSLTVISIRYHDLCRLLHFGSHSIKLVASQCLVELLTRISDQRNRTHDELRCSARYLKSTIAVIEGLVFYGDSKIAINCGVCLSMILGWEKLGLRERIVVKDSKWCRLIIEELALSLAAPGLASRSFTNQHKPAAHIAVALLRLDQVPEWMRSVFDVPCISGLIDNLSASNVSAEMVELFRALVAREYLNKEQIAGLHHVFQACRKHTYKDNTKVYCTGECFQKFASIPHDTDKVCKQLIHLMLCPTSTEFSRIQTEDGRLLEEIDMFYQESTKR